MDILTTPEDRGYPAEYLLARIRGRRSRLTRDWRPLLMEVRPVEGLPAVMQGPAVREGSQERMWRDLVREYRWAYSQMNSGLRRIFRPFFIHAELRTLFTGLRNVTAAQAGIISELLGLSLLSTDIKRLLAESADSRSAVAGIERVFLSLSDRFRGLVAQFDASGLRGVEQAMTNTLLSVMVEGGQHALLRMYFRRLIDSRNIMSAFKYFRLDMRTEPVFIDGGTVAAGRFRDIIRRQKAEEVVSLVREFTGMQGTALDPTGVEIGLYRGMTRSLKQARRGESGEGLILDYLWRCSLEAMNLSVLFHGRDLERDLVAAELVQ